MLHSLESLRDDNTSASAGLRRSACDFTSIVNNAEFPCVFSSAPFAREEVFFGRVDSNSPRAVVSLLKDFCTRLVESPDAVGVIFVEQAGDPSLEDDLELARSIVQAVMEQNAADGNAKELPEPGDPDWRLWLDHTELFINFSSPRHLKRRSRNVGLCFTLIVQARASFDHPSFRSPRARGEIRKRLGKYDAVAPHPSLGDFNDPDDHDAVHFFLGDGDQPLDVTESGGSHSSASQGCPARP